MTARRNLSTIPLNVVNLAPFPIYQQLQIEEALLRTSQENWCILNTGSSPAIVMGISGKAEELIHEEQRKKHNIPVIRRFSGGGTVVVDEATLFVTFIFNSNEIQVPCYPAPIMSWTESFYKDVFQHEGFAARENDYVIHHRKCGGNAQYLCKDRWLHHTSFLWHYCEEKMSCLQHPKKTPAYREGRKHTDFICSLKDHLPHSQSEFIFLLEKQLETNFSVIPISSTLLEIFLNNPHRKSTEMLP